MPHREGRVTRYLPPAVPLRHSLSVRPGEGKDAISRRFNGDLNPNRVHAIRDDSRQNGPMILASMDPSSFFHLDGVGHGVGSRKPDEFKPNRERHPDRRGGVVDYGGRKRRVLDGTDRGTIAEGMQ